MSKLLASLMRIYFFETYVGCTASYFVKIILCSRWYCNPHHILRLCIALFEVAEGWLLLDIGWFVLFYKIWRHYLSTLKVTTDLYWVAWLNFIRTNRHNMMLNVYIMLLHEPLCMDLWYCLKPGNCKNWQWLSLLFRNTKRTLCKDGYN